MLPVVVVFLVLILTLPVLSMEKLAVTDNTGKAPHPVPKITSKVKIDGVLDDEVWENALALTLDYEIFPGTNVKPPVKTELLLLYSDSHVYAAFKAYDPEPSKIRARYTDRDNFPGDDYVAVRFDTFNDSRRVFSICCNPLGVQADMIESTVGGGHQWDAIWDSAGKITDWGFAVEMAIPFSSLRFQEVKGGQVWGLEAMRGYPRGSFHTICLFPVDRNDNCRMCKAVRIIGFKGANQGKGLELDPTLSTIYTQERPAYTEQPFEANEVKAHPGISARWSISPNLTMNAAVNPDFSNVEADAALLDVNTQFAIYYPERRPFFTEGFSIFNTRLLAVNTRAFADPDWGIKLSGKTGRSAIGFFTAQDSITNLIFPGSQNSMTTSLSMNTFGTVARYRSDIGRSSTIGFLVTDREGDDYFNRLGGLDLDLRITPKDRIRVQFLGSQTRYPDQVSVDYAQPDEDFWGTALDLYYFHNSKNMYWYFIYQNLNEKFRADLGFIPQVDYQMYDGGWQYVWRRRAGSWFTMMVLGGSYDYTKGQDGSLLKKGANFWLNYHGPVQSFLDVTGSFGKRTYLGIEFDEKRVVFNSGMQPGLFVLGFKGIVGDQIDFWNVRPGRLLRLNPIIEYKAAPHLVTGVDHVFERLNVDGGTLYTANITNFRAIYHLNRRTFLRAILQYVNYDFNKSLYLFPMDDLQKNLFTQFLFSYKINPQTVLYLGYSDNYDGNQDIRLLQNNRTVFLKIGYALVL